ncbi:hypothetical protein E2C01_075030 [Portunus trituberculatus]|uniref:Uncharacterized protein n=1 Tax=Portunus trituberculatus TaxID=210409 RepID=A0A5B7I7E4_PORTR|nr:hypothetical protein [Portunus trituberculatus]
MDKNNYNNNKKQVKQQLLTLRNGNTSQGHYDSSRIHSEPHLLALEKERLRGGIFLLSPRLEVNHRWQLGSRHPPCLVSLGLQHVITQVRVRSGWWWWWW